MCPRMHALVAFETPAVWGTAAIHRSHPLVCLEMASRHPHPARISCPKAGGLCHMPVYRHAAEGRRVPRRTIHCSCASTARTSTVLGIWPTRQRRPRVPCAIDSIKCTSMASESANAYFLYGKFMDMSASNATWNIFTQTGSAQEGSSTPIVTLPPRPPRLMSAVLVQTCVPSCPAIYCDAA